MNEIRTLRHNGILAALAAALLFGAGTPVAKWLLQSLDPWLLAGLLYLGSGFGLAIYRYLGAANSVQLGRRDAPWLAGAIVAGGIVAPVLLMLGLARMPASDASLLLNCESAFTALLAWFVFKENFDRRIVLGVAAIVVGAIVLSWPSAVSLDRPWSAAAVLGACLAWAIDNNLTRKVSLLDASWLASVKGLVAGCVNVTLALLLGAALPAIPDIAIAMVVGLIAYGLSLVLFIIALRHLGTARTGAYFSVAPFFGAMVAIFMGEPITTALIAAGILMTLGVWLHLTERHTHPHSHEAVDHEHEHVHDEHHQHAHEELIPPGTVHQHRHQHAPLRHSHRHYPDVHHQHKH